MPQFQPFQPVGPTGSAPGYVQIRKYVDACKIVKGLESKFGYFVTKAAEAPKAPEVTETVTEEVKATDKAKKER